MTAATKAQGIGNWTADEIERGVSSGGQINVPPDVIVAYELRLIRHLLAGMAAQQRPITYALDPDSIAAMFGEE